MVVVGDIITIKVRFKNTGSVAHQFPVGLSLLKPGGGWLDLPYQMHSLSPGATKLVTFVRTMLSSDPLGSYGYDAAVWTSPDGGDLQGLLDREEARNVFVLT